MPLSPFAAPNSSSQARCSGQPGPATLMGVPVASSPRNLVRGSSMSTLDAAGIAQQARRLDLLSEEQLLDVWADLGSRDGPAEPFLRAAERKGYLTPWQGRQTAQGRHGRLLPGRLPRSLPDCRRQLWPRLSGRQSRGPARSSPSRCCASDGRRTSARSSCSSGRVRSACRCSIRTSSSILWPSTAIRPPANITSSWNSSKAETCATSLRIRKKLEAKEALRLLEETASGLSHALSHRPDAPRSEADQHPHFSPTRRPNSWTSAGRIGRRRPAKWAARSIAPWIMLDSRKRPNARAGDLRSDIYFLGTTFHEMVTGRPLLTVTREAEGPDATSSVRDLRPAAQRRSRTCRLPFFTLSPGWWPSNRPNDSNPTSR